MHTPNGKHCSTKILPPLESDRFKEYIDFLFVALKVHWVVKIRNTSLETLWIV